MSTSRILSLSDFSYTHPPHLVAQAPLADRDHSRLLLRSSNGELTHSKFEYLTEHLPSKTLLVVNNTKVFASRVIGKLPDGSPVEIFMLAKPHLENGEALVPCFLRPARKIEEGVPIPLEGNCVAKVIKKSAKGEMGPSIVTFSSPREDFSAWLSEHAFVPLPPYIKREAPLPWNKSSDSKSYQTVYANEEGSVAAPTAGLHFTNRLLEKLNQKGIRTCPITLHVSSGTFLPVKTQTISEHPMHTERYFIPSTSWEQIQSAKKDGYKILAVGTTSFRCVESFLRLENRSENLNRWQETNLFVHPKTREERYKSEIFDGILSNFHQPCSTLFMLVSALIGLDETQSLYKEAIADEYRLFSYGDSSLLWF